MNYKFDFGSYVKKVTKEIDKLETFSLPPLQKWIVDWDLLKSKKKNDWSMYPFDRLKSDKEYPFVYFFTTNEDYASGIYKALLSVRITLSDFKKQKIVPQIPIPNISHVPTTFRESTCIYVGSKKSDLYGRLISHLGHGATDTGAMHLDYALQTMNPKPYIAFNYYKLDKKYLNITEHIESAIYDELRPFIGKRGIREFKNL